MKINKKTAAWCGAGLMIVAALGYGWRKHKGAGDQKADWVEATR